MVCPGLEGMQPERRQGGIVSFEVLAKTSVGRRGGIMKRDRVDLRVAGRSDAFRRYAVIKNGVVARDDAGKGHGLVIERGHLGRRNSVTPRVVVT